MTKDNAVRKIIQVVPKRGSSICGVADYATRLAEALLTTRGVATTFLVTSRHAEDSNRADKWVTENLMGKSNAHFSLDLERVVAEHEAEAVLVHLSIYGYQQKGLPTWLPHGLEEWSRRSRVPLGIVFHELWAEGTSPLSTSFWTGFAQRSIVCRSARTMNFGITTTKAFAATLAQSLGKKQRPVSVCNVFSTIDGPEEVDLSDDRSPTLLIFGTEAITKYYQNHAAELGRLLDLLRVQKIIDIGRRSMISPKELAGRPVRSLGQLPAETLSAELMKARFGLLPYSNVAVLGKSTVMAAYMSHGVVPLALSPFNATAAEIKDGVHFTSASSLSALDRGSAPRLLAAIRANNWQDYSGRRPERVAELIDSLILRYATFSAIGSTEKGQPAFARLPS